MTSVPHLCVRTSQTQYDDVRAAWPSTVHPDASATDFTHNMLVFALSAVVTYESFIKTGLIA